MAKAAGSAADKKGKTKKFKKKERKHVPHGLVHVQASFNNTIVTISDPNGNTVSWKSSGSLGFRGSRKGTPFAAQQAAMNAANQARDHGMRSGTAKAASLRNYTLRRFGGRQPLCGIGVTSLMLRTSTERKP